MTRALHPIELHYTGDGFAERILAVAKEAGIERITPEVLGPADEFHTGGLPATRDLARLASFEPGSRLLDIGCGLGGPARVLAHEFGCDVTGVDLTAEFIRSANILAEACGLSDRARFVVGNALALDLPDASFDGAWTQHAVMNIEDRATFYAEIARMLRPGARFAFFDVLRGANPEPLDYPLPWAAEPSISFLHDVARTRALVEGAGFEILEWRELTQQAPVLNRQAAALATPGLTLRIILGESFGDRIRNIAAATADGRLTLLQAVCRKR
ncbi:MAG: class I SAM-dependent methyltransferase [Dehalococcoidia bacterium]|nr:class I SAM-dependent methyltransferase [Dehalococcoidia bacterium]